MTYSDSVKQIFRNSPRSTSSQNFKTISAVLFEYGNILLKTYIEIAVSGDLSKLIVSGSATTAELVERWESIVQENSRRNGDRRYDAYHTLLQNYAELVASHTVVSASLEILWWKVDFPIIDDVRSRGFKIDTINSERYKQSIISARAKCKNLITRYEMQRKEIERQFGQNDQKESSYTYEEIIGSLELGLERTIMDSDTLTLAKYNVLKKGIQRKNEQRINQHRGSGSK